MAHVHIQQPAKIETSDPVIRQRIEDIEKISERCFEKASLSPKKESFEDCTDELLSMRLYIHDDQLRQLLPWNKYIDDEFERIDAAYEGAKDDLLDALMDDHASGTREKFASAFVTSDKTKAREKLRRCAEDLGKLIKTMIVAFARTKLGEMTKRLDEAKARVEKAIAEEKAHEDSGSVE